ISSLNDQSESALRPHANCPGRLFNEIGHKQTLAHLLEVDIGSEKSGPSQTSVKIPRCPRAVVYGDPVLKLQELSSSACRCLPLFAYRDLAGLHFPDARLIGFDEAIAFAGDDQSTS
ncbi:hypothetical protein, partial [Brevundimonas nasdae]